MIFEVALIFGRKNQGFIAELYFLLKFFKNSLQRNLRNRSEIFYTIQPLFSKAAAFCFAPGVAIIETGPSFQFFPARSRPLR